MNLNAFLNVHRTRSNCGFVPLTPPNVTSLQKPAVRQAVRAVVSGKETVADLDTLRQHWMLVD